MTEHAARSNPTPAEVVDLRDYRTPGPDVIEGTVLPRQYGQQLTNDNYTPVLDFDPVADAPLIPSWLKSKEGRKARAKYLGRLSLRKTRRPPAAADDHAWHRAPRGAGHPAHARVGARHRRHPRDDRQGPRPPQGQAGSCQRSARLAGR